MIKNKWKRRIKYCVSNQRGETLMEVLVAFALLMILMAGLYHIVRTSQNMFMQAKDRETALNIMQENICREGKWQSVNPAPELKLVIDNELTDATNKAADTTIALDAKTFIYKQDDIGIKIYRVDKNDD